MENLSVLNIKSKKVKEITLNENRVKLIKISKM